MQLQPLQDKFDRIYENLAFNDEVMETDRLLEPVLDSITPQSLWQHIQQHLSPEQQNELLSLMNAQDDTSSQQSLP